MHDFVTFALFSLSFSTISTCDSYLLIIISAIIFQWRQNPLHAAICDKDGHKKIFFHFFPLFTSSIATWLCNQYWIFFPQTNYLNEQGDMLRILKNRTNTFFYFCFCSNVMENWWWKFNNFVQHPAVIFFGVVTHNLCLLIIEKKYKIEMVMLCTLRSVQAHT